MSNLNGNSPVQKLVTALHQEFQQSPKAGGVLDLLGNYCQNETDWKSYAHFNDDHYTRNLIARTELFDLIVLCWGKDQISPIHNHAGQRCWMTILEGSIFETLYHRHSDSNNNQLEKGETRTYEQGVVGYITDDIALHIIGATHDQPAISLHLYSLPYDECNIYDPVTGEVSPKKLSFYTVDGQPV
ncbi:MAG: cysteine dioxygenase family protein [Planctomycetota bacterium]|jgi:cysteine dioxygenase|nr:cysteine dioxygenase family protein [Planctomycetota bacterium]